VSRFCRDLDGKYINYTSLACTNDGIDILLDILVVLLPVYEQGGRLGFVHNAWLGTDLDIILFHQSWVYIAPICGCFKHLFTRFRNKSVHRSAIMSGKSLCATLTILHLFRKRDSCLHKNSPSC